eukprot:2148835-Rhodomonas_salina.2
MLLRRRYAFAVLTLAIMLRLGCAVSSTNKANAFARRCPVLTSRIVLRFRYAMWGTKVTYAATQVGCEYGVWVGTTASRCGLIRGVRY